MAELPPNGRVLLIRTDRIGDVVLSTPVATAIKRAFPESHIIFLARNYTRGLLEFHRDVDEVWTEEELEKGGHPTQFLRKAHLDATIALHPEPKWAWRLWRARVPLRVGTAYRAFSLFYNVRVKEHRKRTPIHEAEHNLNLLKPLGITDFSVEFHFQLPDELVTRVRGKLFAKGIEPGQPFVVLHPGSGGSAVDWPPHFFGELAFRLNGEGIPIVVTGSAAEGSLTEEVSRGGRLGVNLAGELSLEELAATLKLAGVVVANSTGPLHLAVALGTEVVGLYCPVPPCYPERWGPYGRMDSVLVPASVPCKSCSDKTCAKSRCMEQISVEAVFEKVKEKLRIDS